MADDIERAKDEAIQLDIPVIEEEPEQNIEFEEGDSGKTLSEVEEESPHQSDIQSVLKYLHPKYKNLRLNELLQSAMSSRVFPDNFWDKFYFLVMSLIEEDDGDKSVDIVSIISSVQDALSIGFEGRGRVEDLEVAGVVHEQEMEKLTKELGLG